MLRSIGNISRQLMPDPPVAEPCVIGFGLRTYRDSAGQVAIDSNRCHVTVQTPAGDQFFCQAMDRGATLEGEGWRVVWEQGEAQPRVER